MLFSTIVPELLQKYQTNVNYMKVRFASSNANRRENKQEEPQADNSNEVIHY